MEIERSGAENSERSILLELGRERPLGPAVTGPQGLWGCAPQTHRRLPGEHWVGRLQEAAEAEPACAWLPLSLLQTRGALANKARGRERAAMPATAQGFSPWPGDSLHGTEEPEAAHLGRHCILGLGRTRIAEHAGRRRLPSWDLRFTPSHRPQAKAASWASARTLVLHRPRLASCTLPTG